VLFVKETEYGVLFRIRVQPRASRTEAAGLHGDALKLRIAAPPVDGAANKACIRFLAKALKVPKSSVEIVSGGTGRDKTVLVAYPEPDPGQGDRNSLRRAVEGLANG